MHVSHETAVGVVEDVAVKHPHAGPLVEYHGNRIVPSIGTLTVSFHAMGQIWRIGLEGQEEETVQVQRVRHFVSFFTVRSDRRLLPETAWPSRKAHR